METSTDFGELFNAFEKLRPDINLEFRIDVHTTKYFPIELAQARGGFPTSAHIDYVHVLQKARTTLLGAGRPASLIDEWIRLRSWLFGILPQLQRRAIVVVPDDVDQQLQIFHEQMPHHVQLDLRNIIVKTWRAHNNGDSAAFMAGKGELLQWWTERCNEKNKTITDGRTGA